jgi:glycine/D-amino acid oxidase-like deaminating enzyme
MAGDRAPLVEGMTRVAHPIRYLGRAEFGAYVLRPMTPSLMPRVGAGSRPGVFYNTGHGHLGWTLSAATAETVADAVHAAAEGQRAALAA